MSEDIEYRDRIIMNFGDHFQIKSFYGGDYFRTLIGAKAAIDRDFDEDNICDGYKYVVISNRDQSNFELEVNALLAEGWELRGLAMMKGECIHQVMTRLEE